MDKGPVSAAAAQNETPASPEPLPRDAPLSFNQEWALLNLELGFGRLTGPTFPLVFRFKVAVDHATVGRALNAIIRRHEAFRMAYLPTDIYWPEHRRMQLSLFARTGTFVPGLHRQTLVSSARVHIQDRLADSEDEIEQVIESELDRSLDMATPPQMRATMIHVGGRQHVLVIVMSHVTLDGWSVGLFLREFGSLLRGYLSNAEPMLPPVDMQYHAFAAWQHREYRAGRLAQEEQYWSQQWALLDGADIRHHEFPFAVSGQPDRLGAASFLHERLGLAESAAIRALVKKLQTTPYLFFRTVMTAVLHHYTRKRRLAFWANLANREFAQFYNMIGWCSNTHLVSVDVGPHATGMSLCSDVSAAMSAARANEALPLPALWIAMGRRHPQDTRVNFDLLPRRPTRREGQPFDLDLRAMRGMDLDVRIQDSDDGFRFAVTHSRRYSPDGVAAMLASLLRVSAALVAKPEIRIADCAPLIEFYRGSAADRRIDRVGSPHR